MRAGERVEQVYLWVRIKNLVSTSIALDSMNELSLILYPFPG